ncbi:MAG: hypothetical protein IKO95_02345 [Spirochaetia bacterium]|nr:hypothetical protein [Spirochaetia bacterium]
MKPTEEWRKLVFDLSDQAFFDLVRNYLGDIHTPFNKHNLLDQLEAFLLNGSNLNQIISMIDSSDAALLSAIDFLGKASIEQLYALFRDEKPYYSFYTHLMNLEERMLICPAGGKGNDQAVVISPLFRDELEKQVIDIDLFLGCRKAPVKKKSQYSWYDVPVISAYVSGILTKKGKSIVPEYGDILKNILLRYSMLHQTGRHLIPARGAFDDLFALENQQVSQFFVHAYLLDNPLVAIIYANMRADRSYPDRAFARLVKCSAYLAGLEAGEIQAYKEDLIKAELAAEDSTGLRKLTSLQGTDEGKIVVQPDFSLYSQGVLSLEENMTLAFYSEIKELDVISRWEVTRESFMRGIRSGIGAGSFIRLLEEKSGSPLPQNILFSFKSWEEECQGISVYRGCVIKVDGRFSKLLDSNSHFKRYIKEKLSDGLYLIADEDFPEAMKVVEGVSGQSLDLPPEKTSPGVLVTEEDNSGLKRFQNYVKPAAKAKKHNISVKLLKKIETLDITQEQKEILSDRVHRKLILSEQQLAGSGVRYELMEARGIDYNRKVRLCQHVMETGGAFLELTLGAEETLLIKPIQLKKSGNDMLVIGDEIPDGALVQVPLRKVHYMRKVRTSLMG